MFNYYNKPDERNMHELKLTRCTLNPWKNVLEIFDRENKIQFFFFFISANKIQLMCMFPSNEGFCWFNFFWVRGDYINKYCENPIITILL